MAMWIDWHSHHTPPEVVEKFAAFTGKKPKIDDYDSTDFNQRVKEMDDVGLGLQLICQGAGLYADQLPAEQALEIVRQSNDILAERIAPHRDRLMGITALSLKNIEASVKELERTSSQGFRAALLYPTVDGEMIVDLPEMNPVYGNITELGSPIFLEHFLLDCGSSDARMLAFLIDTMGEKRIVFGSDYCGGLGPLTKCLAAVDKQSDPDRVKSVTEKSSRKLLHI